MNETLGVLETTRGVVERSQAVRIDRRAIDEFCHRLLAENVRPPEWDRNVHFYDGGARTVQYLLILDSLNFCFWGEPRWRIVYRGQPLDGYNALAAALKRTVEDGGPILDADYLSKISKIELRHIFQAEGKIALFEERLRILQETGSVLAERYDGSATSLVERAGERAVKLARRLVADFPSFRDEASHRGDRVRFYKRAQIFAADLHGAFDGKAWGTFTDLDRLTCFADYKLPQVLRHLGILIYAPPLAAAVDLREPIEAGSEVEVEIRASTVWAVEWIRRGLATSGMPLKSVEIDWILWHLGQQERFNKHPHHRTLTVFY
ncbi:MAG: queuosine salvage family protein [Candidatus Bipolaricaulia bacterium]